MRIEVKVRKLSCLVAAVVAALLARVGAASASPRAHEPSGSSQLDQYIETAPDPGGGRPAGNLGPGNPGILPPGTAHRLHHSGAGGQATANVAVTTAPPPSGKAGKSSGGGQSNGKGGKGGKVPAR